MDKGNAVRVYDLPPGRRDFTQGGKLVDIVEDRDGQRPGCLCHMGFYGLLTEPNPDSIPSKLTRMRPRRRSELARWP